QRPAGDRPRARGRLPRLIENGPKFESSWRSERRSVMPIPSTEITEAVDTSRQAGEVAVRIRKVTKQFGTGDQRVLALRGVDWVSHAGQFSRFAGPWAWGKTPLLGVLAGTLDCDAGQVEIFGAPFS